jgi:hypothetical protein
VYAWNQCLGKGLVATTAEGYARLGKSQVLVGIGVRTTIDMEAKRLPVQLNKMQVESSVCAEILPHRPQVAQREWFSSRQAHGGIDSKRLNRNREDLISRLHPHNFDRSTVECCRHTGFDDPPV